MCIRDSVYAVKKELSDEWITFGNIEGFDFEEKYECKIKISETSYLDYGMGEPYPRVRRLLKNSFWL